MNDKNETVTLDTAIILAGGFDMPLTELLNAPEFGPDNLDTEQ